MIADGVPSVPDDEITSPTTLENILKGIFERLESLELDAIKLRGDCRTAVEETLKGYRAAADDIDRLDDLEERVATCETEIGLRCDSGPEGYCPIDPTTLSGFRKQIDRLYRADHSDVCGGQALAIAERLLEEVHHQRARTAGSARDLKRSRRRQGDG